MQVRPACADDVEEIVTCLRLAFEPFRSQYTEDAFRDTVPSTEAIRQRIADMNVYVAVASDKTVAGTLAAAVLKDEGHLRGMAVHPEWQGRASPNNCWQEPKWIYVPPDAPASLSTPRSPFSVLSVFTKKTDSSLPAGLPISSECLSTNM